MTASVSTGEESGSNFSTVGCSHVRASRRRVLRGRVNRDDRRRICELQHGLGDRAGSATEGRCRTGEGAATCTLDLECAAGNGAQKA